MLVLLTPTSILIPISKESDLSKMKFYPVTFMPLHRKIWKDLLLFKQYIQHYVLFTVIKIIWLTYKCTVPSTGNIQIQCDNLLGLHLFCPKV